MEDSTGVVLPHGGYKKLIVYRKSDVIYAGTVLFCKRFLPAWGDRTVDQMTQSARSCKQNIVEGSATSGTSKESEIRLTGVARATLDELQQDYLDYLKTHNYTEWAFNSKEKVFARKYAREHNDWDDWAGFFSTRNDYVCCNLMIVLIFQMKYMLERMLARQLEEYIKSGGLHERLQSIRNEYRGEEWSKVVYGRLASASTPQELRWRADEIKQSVDRIACSIARQRRY